MIAKNTFASLFESSFTPVCASINQKFIYANQAFLDMAGYNIDELLGLPITILVNGIAIGSSQSRYGCDRQQVS